MVAKTTTNQGILQHYRKYGVSNIEFLPVDQLQVDSRYQRPLSAKKVKIITEGFNVASAGILIVSLRENGDYFVCDGQHRLAAMRQLRTASARCEVYLGLTLADEALIFYNCNTNRKAPLLIDNFRARLLAGDEKAKAIKAIVESEGFTIQQTGNSTRRTHPNAISAVGALEEIYRRGGDDGLRTILRIVHQTWPDEFMAIEQRMLLGLWTFHEIYKDEYMQRDLVDKLRMYPVQKIVQEAVNYSSLIGGGVIHNMGYGILQVYNKGRRSTRLPDRISRKAIP